MKGDAEQATTFDFWLDEAEHPFSGWDFSHIIESGRMVTAPLLWSYTSEVLLAVRLSRSLLDMDTGGGEFLAGLQPLPPHTCATEGYSPNLPIARQRLEPLGATVHEVGEDGILPFADGEFDLVINRHGSYLAEEVYRVLKPCGGFVTQQVGGTNDWGLNKMLGAEPNRQWEVWTLDFAVRDLAKARFEIEVGKEAYPITRIFDIGALIYQLKAIPWQIPDFSVAEYRGALLHIHRQISEKGYVDVNSHRFFIKARRLAA
jgi:SAM-dependent methyltransferase